MISLSKLMRLFLVTISGALFAIGVLQKDTTILNLSILLLWLNNFLYCLERPEKRIVQLMFGISFFAFLLGRPIAELITPRINYHHFKTDILIHTSICLFLSLLFLHTFEYVFERVVFLNGSNRDLKMDYESGMLRSIRRVSTYVFYFSYPFAILIIAEKILFVRSLGYIALYTDYASRFPYIFTKIGDMAEIALFMFLATMPSQEECKVPLVMYALQALAALFTGKRGRFVIPFFLIFIYLVKRNQINSGGKKWITKKTIVMILACVPFVMAFLYIYSSLRSGGAVGQESFIDNVSGILNETGFSVNIINYEKALENSLPNKLFSLGDTIDYLRENFIIRNLFNLPSYKNYTAEKGMYSYSFPHVITYTYNAKFYMSGRGLGSCYIAEAYHDFGYLGVIVWNIVYALVLVKMYNFESRGCVYTTMALLSLRSIMLAPRNMASAFLTEWISLDNWLVIAAIFLIAAQLRKRKEDATSKKPIIAH